VAIGGFLYFDLKDGLLKYRSPGGTITTIEGKPVKEEKFFTRIFRIIKKWI
jgi:hypothetical protein